MEQLLERSAQFDEAIGATFSGEPFKDSKRAAVAASMCSLGFQHGSALRILVEHQAHSSALALFRCQFEIVTRATWTAFAATEDWIEQFTRPHEGVLEPVRSPDMNDMLRGIAEKAPAKAHQMLSELKNAIWKPLHSYVHGGVRPVAENLIGYQSDFLEKTILNSNGLSAMAAMVMAGLMEDEATIFRVLKLHFDFLDCLPDGQGKRQPASHVQS